MEEQVVKKRAWVKNAVIVFLSIMLVLTFFSNTIMNRSLPEVACTFVESGAINAKIRGSGTVTAGESYEVIMDQAREVASVLVRVGDSVMAGDVLFTLAETESEELKNAIEVLERSRLDYERMLLNMDTADYAQENRNIEKAREALAKAQARVAECMVSDQDVLMAEMALKDAQRAKTETEKAYAKFQTEMADVKLEYDTLEAKVKSLEAEQETLSKTIDGYEDQIRDLKNGLGNPKDDLKTAEKALEAAKKVYATSRIAYGEKYDELEAEAKKYVAAGDVIYQMEALVNGDQEPWCIEDQGYKIAFTELRDALKDLDKCQAEYDKAKALYDSADSVQEQIHKLEDLLDKAEDDYGDTRSAIKSAKRDMEDLEEAVEDFDSETEWYQQQLEFAQQNIETLDEQLGDLKDKQANYESALEQVESSQTHLEDLLFALAEQKKNDNKTSASAQLDLDAKKKEILEQEELVAELQTNALGAEVTAKVSGQISSLNVTAGRDAAAGETLAVIEVVDRGYTVRLPVTAEQSKKVRIGDKAEVTNYYWGEQIEATLTQIANDPSNPGKGKMLVFTLTGDISSGQNVTLAVGEKSANFDSLVPKSALRTDTNGSFVFVITAKSSPLGNRYIATRADVQVLAQDDTTAAVSGLSMGDYVITTSSKPLEAGMQVNMVEN